MLRLIDKVIRFSPVASTIAKQQKEFHLKSTFLLKKSYCTTNLNESANEDAHDKQKGNKDEDDVRISILKASIPHVYDHGWSDEAISKGCEQIGLSMAAQGMFPRGGIELVEYFYDDCNHKMSEHLLNMDVTKNQRALDYNLAQNAMEMRLRLIIPYIEQWPHAMALMALPQNVKYSMRNLYNLVDEICHHVGHHSTDFTWYSKRLSLAAVYKTTEFSLIQDNSEDFQNTWKFLDRRISEVKCCTSLSEKAKEDVHSFSGLLQAGLIVSQNMLSLNRNRR